LTTVSAYQFYSSIRAAASWKYSSTLQVRIMGTKFRNRLGRYDYHAPYIVSGLVNFRIIGCYSKNWQISIDHRKEIQLVLCNRLIVFTKQMNFMNMEKVGKPYVSHWHCLFSNNKRKFTDLSSHQTIVCRSTSGTKSNNIWQTLHLARSKDNAEPNRYPVLQC
jgi:hypothetical protein